MSRFLLHFSVAILLTALVLDTLAVYRAEAEPGARVVVIGRLEAFCRVVACKGWPKPAWR